MTFCGGGDEDSELCIVVVSFAEAHCGAFCGWSVVEVGKDSEGETCFFVFFVWVLGV